MFFVAPGQSRSNACGFHFFGGLPAYVPYGRTQKNDITPHSHIQARRHDFERWLNDDDEDEDSDEDGDSDMQDESIPGHTEYVGRTSFVQRNGSYRKSHEMGALSCLPKCCKLTYCIRWRLR